MSTPQLAPSGAIAPPQGMSGDMKFVGLMYIIFGAFACLSIIGAIIGIPMIIAGLRARESGDAYTAYSGGDGSALSRAFVGQAGCFKMLKVIMIIQLVCIALYFLFIIVMIALGGFAAFVNR
jgi:hypothetical protein